MYIIAGTVMEQLTGITWEEMVRQMILTPLAMTDSGFADDMDAAGEAVIDYLPTSDGWAQAVAGIHPALRETCIGADAGPCGAITAITIPFEPAVEDIVFTRE